MKVHGITQDMLIRHASTRRQFLAAGALGLAVILPAGYLALDALVRRHPGLLRETTAGWRKHPNNPVLGGALGTCFDISLLHLDGMYRMWFSWRPRGSIAVVESQDGVHWSEPQIALGPDPNSNWEKIVNRPSVIRLADGYHLWYTGQVEDRSAIGYAFSPDGFSFQRQRARPVLMAEHPWEDVAVMCPHVVYDQASGLFRMWYSGGEQYEPNAIGYATSLDGLAWVRHERNPIFQPEPSNYWEQQRVTACQVIPTGNWHLMFYIGFSNVHTAQIGLARSKDGISGWERHPANPIVRPSFYGWDADAVYKPYAIFDGRQWLLWYNGRCSTKEQIGLAIHLGEDLGFEK